MAVVYDEGRKATFSREGVTVTRHLRVTPYTDVGYVADLLLGGCRIIGGRLFRIWPARDPIYPWCICTKVDEEGLGAYTGTAESGLQNLIKSTSYAQGSRLVVTYETPTSGQSTMNPADGDLEDPPGAPSSPPTGGGAEPTNQQEIDLASESYDYGYQYQPISGQFVGFAPSVGATPDRLLTETGIYLQKRIPKIETTLIRHYVVRAPWTAIGQMMGTVNKSAFVRGRVSWPIETMRFEGLQTQRKLTSFGVKFWELTFKFSILILYDKVNGGGKAYVGWQRMYDVKTGWWSYVVGVQDRNRTLFEYDEDNASQTIGGATVAGFKLLFHPRVLS